MSLYQKVVVPALKIIAALTAVGFLGVIVVAFLLPYVTSSTKITAPSGSAGSAKGIVVLIEYQDTVGLTNLVNELYKNDVHSLLHAGPDFVEDNCETIKTLTNYNVSLVGGCGDELWDKSYEEQKEVMTETKERIEACTGRPLEFITSRYWAWDENTVKIAEELGIDNIFARGMVENGAAVFQPEDYNVKILAISNIKSVPFKYGSMCDYSYWIRNGEPADMLAEIDDAITNNNKISPVSHTNIGGLKKDWFTMWQEMLSDRRIDWVSWQEFSQIDYQMPLSRIPQNKNVPYTPAMREGREELYQQGENVANPCAVEELPPVDDTTVPTKEPEKQEPILMFHNDRGSMCLEAKEFFSQINYPVKEVLVEDEDFTTRLQENKSQFNSSQGVSEDFSYYPIIFAGDVAYSGFDETVRQQLEDFIARQD